MVVELFEDEYEGAKRVKNKELLRERTEKGLFHTVVQVSLQDTPAFKEMMKMNTDQFAEI